jgi:hypothetical protein
MNDDAGRATTRLTAHGETLAAALAAALAQLLSIVQPGAAPTGSGRSIAIRAEATDPAALLPALVSDLLDRIDEHGDSIAALDLHGVVRADDGLVAWGMLELGIGPTIVPRPIALRDVRVDERLSGVTIDAAIDLTGG